MLCAYAASQSSSDPLSGLVIGERPDPVTRPGWSVVRLRACGLNHHDLWSLQGVGLPADRLPMVLGCDGAGVDEAGNEVIIHAVVPSEGWAGDETLDPARSLLSERYDGTLAELVAVPSQNLVPKPAGLSFEQAACLSTAWLTAYRMLFVNAGLTPGATVLVQGAGGGVATALIALGKAGGFRVWTTSRDEAKRERALDLGADAAYEPGTRLPERVDAVMETVGQATWDHSLKSLKPGGRIVICGATSGANPPADLNRVFFLQLSIIGSTMGSREELVELADFCLRTGVRPLIDSTFALRDARSAFERLASGDAFGKIVFTND